MGEMKQQFARSKLKESDPEKAEKLKEAAKKRKAEQRKREKERDANKENNEGDETTSEASGSETTQRRKSRRSEDLGGPLVSLDEGFLKDRSRSGDFSDVSLVSEDSFVAPGPSPS